MNEIQLARRAFLRQTGIAARNSLIVLSLSAIMSSSAAASEATLENSAFKILGSDEAREFAAIAARIIPTDETPGATEAGVIYFIDNVLGTSRTEALEPMREGLASLQASAQSTYGSASFSALTPEQQDALLVSIEETAFFGTMRYMTISGMFSLPEYGGNRDYAGWKLIGFEHKHVWSPPYGFYDADYMARGE
ncbi:MAG: gluconate 2-dehydrogenase subunit 3 family protein [Gammaproteobacteria bacterium]|nr:gluconate 2-dehydrogenase subunit 3 family protein [Gammaproteobacteria bacterium]